MKGTFTLFFEIIFVLLSFQVVAQNSRNFVPITESPILSVSSDGLGNVCVGEIATNGRKQIVRYSAEKKTREVIVEDGNPQLNGLRLFSGNPRQESDRYNSIGCDNVRVTFFGFGPLGQPNLLTKRFNSNSIDTVISLYGQVNAIQLPERTSVPAIMDDIVLVYSKSGRWFALAYLLPNGGSKTIPTWIEIDMLSGSIRNLIPKDFITQNNMGSISAGCFTRGNYWTTFHDTDDKMGVIRISNQGKIDIPLKGSLFIQNNGGKENGIACNENTAAVSFKDTGGYKFTTFNDNGVNTTNTFDTISGFTMRNNTGIQLDSSGNLYFIMDGSLFKISGQKGEIVKSRMDAPAGVITDLYVSKDDVYYTASSGGFTTTNKLFAVVEYVAPPPPKIPIISAVVDVVNQRPTSLVPNGLITILGDRLSPIEATIENYYIPGITVAMSTPLPTLLGGSKVLINGREIPLLFSVCFKDSSCQINAQVPSDILGPTARLKILRFTEVNGFTLESQSEEIVIEVKTHSPTIFMNGEIPILQIADRDYQLLTRYNVVKAGESIVGYGTGFGINNPLILTGVPAGPIYAPVAQTTKAWVKFKSSGSEKYWEVTILAFASPQSVGVTQFNILNIPSVEYDTRTDVYLVIKVGDTYLPDMLLPYSKQ